MCGGELGFVSQQLDTHSPTLPISLNTLKTWLAHNHWVVQRIFVLLIIDPETFQYSGLLDTYVLLCCRQYRECSGCVYNYTCIKIPLALRLAGFSLCYSSNDESKLYLMCAHACTTCGSNLYKFELIDFTFVHEVCLAAG